MRRFLKVFIFVNACVVLGFFIGFLLSNSQKPVENSISITNNSVTMDDTIYTIFSMNVHDWVFPEKSIETLNRVIDLHEKYNVPVDIYLTDPMVQLYVYKAPDLIERLKTSPMVVVNYHLRPPNPLYEGFDFIGLAEMPDAELSATLLGYEEHSLDLETGLPTDLPGGYEYLKSVIGYAPKVVTHTTDAVTGPALSAIYEKKGAVFAVVHGKDSNLGDELHGLYIRPEHVEVKLYESARKTTDASMVFENALAELSEGGVRFIGIKWHENNFYTNGTPWEAVFWSDENKSVPREPPYDLQLAESSVTLKSKTVQDDYWALYESALAYATENKDTLHPINAFDLEKMVP